MPRQNPVARLRVLAIAEAISFLVLLFIAMPLKYLAGAPGAVKAVGWIHGVLFVVFGVALLQTVIVARWPLARATLVFIAALLPFGPFVLDGRMKTYASEMERG